MFLDPLKNLRTNIWLIWQHKLNCNCRLILLSYAILLEITFLSVCKIKLYVNRLIQWLLQHCLKTNYEYCLLFFFNKIYSPPPPSLFEGGWLLSISPTTKQNERLPEVKTNGKRTNIYSKLSSFKKAEKYNVKTKQILWCKEYSWNCSLTT